MLAVSIALAACTATRAPGTTTITFADDGVITDGDSYLVVDVVDTPPAHTTLTVEGGEVTFALRAWDASRVEIYGGTLASVNAYHQSSIIVHGGNVDIAGVAEQSSLTIEGGRVGRVGAYSGWSSGQVHLYDGIIEESVLLGHQAVMNMYGGEVGTYIQAAEQSQLNLWGGTISGYLYARDESQVNIGGYGFEYDPQGGGLGYGLLTGRWLDGTPFNIRLEGDTYSRVRFVPEPASLVLMLSFVVLATSRTRRRRVLDKSGMWCRRESGQSPPVGHDASYRGIKTYLDKVY
jgi:hypothetical protein